MDFAYWRIWIRRVCMQPAKKACLNFKGHHSLNGYLFVRSLRGTFNADYSSSRDILWILWILWIWTRVEMVLIAAYLLCYFADVNTSCRGLAGCRSEQNTLYFIASRAAIVWWSNDVKLHWFHLRSEAAHFYTLLTSWCSSVQWSVMHSSAV